MEKLNNTIILRVSKADRERIRAKMGELGVMNMSAYIRKMALDGYCVKPVSYTHLTLPTIA